MNPDPLNELKLAKARCDALEAAAVEARRLYEEACGRSRRARREYIKLKLELLEKA